MAVLGESIRKNLAWLTPARLLTGLLVLLIIVQVVRLFWALVTPLGPLGDWQPAKAQVAQVDPGFDPFFRSNAGDGTSAVTGLPLKLFGVRLDSAMGRSSAIIATPDGVQSSFGIGEEVMPGVKLKAVLGDQVVLDRAGAEEKLFIDLSVTAGAAAPATPPNPAVPAPAPEPGAPPPPTLAIPTS